MYKAIIFDFFGVFCTDMANHWLEKNVPNYQAIMPEYRAICTESDYGNLSKADYFKKMSLLTNIPADEISKGFDDETFLDPEIIKYAASLKEKGFKTACVSNGTPEWTTKVIDEYNLSYLFDKIILSGDLGIVKPDPRIYQRALNELEIQASQAIFTDDRQINIDGAIDCGIKSLLYTDAKTFIRDIESICPNLR